MNITKKIVEEKKKPATRVVEMPYNAIMRQWSFNLLCGEAPTSYSPKEKLLKGPEAALLLLNTLRKING